jgi:hypothetical protein
MKTFLALLISSVLGNYSLAATPSGHLKFAEGSIHAHLSWLQGPDENGGESKLLLQWRDGATHQAAEPGLKFETALWMPSMGHGSAPTKIQPQVNEKGEVLLGEYLVSNIYFIMPGEWELRVTLHLKDGSQETQIWPVSL